MRSASTGAATNAAKAPDKITVVVADSQPITLEALEELFTRAGFVVLTACRDGNAALKAIVTHRPDILVFDLDLAGKDGVTILREAKRHDLETRFVLFTAVRSETDILEAIRLGVRGIVLKHMAPDALVNCVRRVHRGEERLEKASAGRILEKLLRHESATQRVALTSRELEILKLVATGLTNKSIAERLSVKEGTVKIHLHNIYKKVSVNNRLALILFAQNKGLL